jgi:hypothetical protein
LAFSEIPIIEFCNKDLGVNYTGRKFDGFNTISTWISADGIMNFKEASSYETKIWSNPDLIIHAPPNENLRAFSYVAGLRGIPQFITTSRTSDLKDVTHAWVSKCFPWIAVSHVNQRSDKTLKGEIYKAVKIAETFEAYSGTVHFEDSISAVRKITKITRDIGIIGFPYSSDEVLDLTSDNRVFLPREAFENLLYYKPFDFANIV